MLNLMESVFAFMNRYTMYLKKKTAISVGMGGIIWVALERDRE